MNIKDIKVGINPIIINENNQILLSKRLKPYGYGTWSLPGGHLKENEDIETSVIREIKEETNLDVTIEDVEVINFARTHEYIQIGILIKKYSGTIINMEPAKCVSLEFFDLNNLPILFMETKVNIELYLQNRFYNKKLNTKAGE